LADLRGAADLAVSFDGSFNYGLLIEVKTTTKQSRSDLGLFYEVTDTDRNKTQLERLVKGAPSWWYVIVNTAKLTAKTHSEHVRAILDCPAVFIEGKGGDTRPMHIMSFNAFSGLLDEMQDCILNLNISKAQPLPAPYHQMDLLPVDDVPVVTMNQPLRQPVVAPVVKVMPELKQRILLGHSIHIVWPLMVKEVEALGGVPAILPHFPQAVIDQYQTLCRIDATERVGRLRLSLDQLFCQMKLHENPIGILVMAWASTRMGTQRFMKQLLPTFYYFSPKEQSRVNIISVMACHARSSQRARKS